MDRVSVRERISNYVKNIFDSFPGAICVIILALGLGTGFIIQHVNYTFDKLRYQQDMLDMMNFNQQLMDSKYKLSDDIDKLNLDIYQMDQIIRQMYNRLQEYETLPNLPDDNNDGRSDA